MKFSMTRAVRKGATVWYWHEKLKDWKKGKVVAVGKYGLSIRRRDDKRLQGVPYYYPAISSSEPKPDCSPQEMRDRLWSPNRYNEKYKLLVKLGIVK